MMNKKMIGALLGTFALGSMNVAFADDKPAGGDAPKAEKKAKKGKKGDKKGGDAKSCGADGKSCSGAK